MVVLSFGFTDFEKFPISLISNNNETMSFSVNLSVNLRIYLSEYKLTPKQEVILIPNLVWRYIRHGEKTTQADFFENQSEFLNIQILSDFFSGFFQ